MGQSSINRKAISQINGKIDLNRLSTAIIKLCSSSSPKFLKDCVLHAGLGQSVLAAHGINSEIVIGAAAWRVGDGDGDVLNHVPDSKKLAAITQHNGSFPFHAWLVARDLILDFTTYQLHAKAIELDQMDGYKTTVNWCPPFLFVPCNSVSSYRNVVQTKAGTYFYQRVPQIESLVLKTFELDAEDAAMLSTLYANPQIDVVGPNHST